MIKTARLQFITEHRFRMRDAEKLRGFFANKFQAEDFFHNHYPDGNSIYRMPLVQYKVIDGVLSIFGYNEAVPLLADKFIKVKEIAINDRVFSHFETSLHVLEEEFSVSEDLYSYVFDSYWLPVNQRNYMQYINNRLDLDRVLRNNLLTNFKGLGIEADKRIMVKGEFMEKKLKVNDIEYFGMLGKFVTNVKMPDYFGIGRMKAIGFGCVRRK
ncbi:MAG: hypothetical protein JXB88_22590 [Spirochaetales bacterium]|nr:hypothetical protein [Spirochaetales bacterium]